MHMRSIDHCCLLGSSLSQPKPVIGRTVGLAQPCERAIVGGKLTPQFRDKLYQHLEYVSSSAIQDNKSSSMVSAHRRRSRRHPLRKPQ